MDERLFNIKLGAYEGFLILNRRSSTTRRIRPLTSRRCMSQNLLYESESPPPQIGAHPPSHLSQVYESESPPPARGGTRAAAAAAAAAAAHKHASKKVFSVPAVLVQSINTDTLRSMRLFFF